MYNPYVIVPLLVWAITQFLKFIIAAAKGRTDFRYLYASGGMPSVHSAVVTSLAFTAFLIDGPQSPIFGITAILAAIVMYDSFGVRRASGEQAAAINRILESLNQDKVKLSQPQQRLREILGHKPLEVTIGAGIGLVLGGLFNASHLGAVVDFATMPIPQSLVIATVVVSSVLIIGAFVLRFVVGPKYRKIAEARQAVNRIFWAFLSLGLVGALVAFLANEKIEAARWLLWPGLLALLFAVIVIFFGNTYRSKITSAIEQQQEILDKQKWLEGPNKKKRAAKARSKKRK